MSEEDFLSVENTIIDLQEAIISFIDNLATTLVHFYVRFVMMNAAIVEAMDRNRAKLQNVNVWLDYGEDNLLQRQFVRLTKSKQQGEQIKSLSIIQTDQVVESDILGFGFAPKPLFKNLINLVELKISGRTYTPQLLFDVLNNLPTTVATLEFTGGKLNYDDVLDMENTTIITKSTNVKDLQFSITSDDYGLLKKMNQIINTVLDACPLLEHLKVCDGGGYRWGPGPLNFNLFNHNKLKTIDFEMGSIGYFLFSEDGKQDQCSIDRNRPYGDRIAITCPEWTHANLMYNTGVKVKVLEAPTKRA